MAGPWDKFKPEQAAAPVAPALKPWEVAAQQQTLAGPTAEKRPWEKAVAGELDGYAKVRKVIDRPFLDAPIVSSEETTDEELDAIAKKHGQDPSVLKEMASYFGAIRPNGSTSAELESSLARGVGLGVPQFVAKKTVEDPKLRAAIDDIRELADSKRSMLRGLAENIVPVGAAGKLATGAARTVAREAGEGLGKQIAKGAGEGAAIGSVASGAQSREGEELSSGAIGLGAGAGLGAAAAGLGAYIGKLSSKAPRAEQEILQEVAEKYKPDIDAGTTRILQETKESEQALAQSISKDIPPTAAEAKVLVREQLDPEFVQLVNKEGTVENTLLRARAERELGSETVAKLGDEAAIEQVLAQDLTLERARTLARNLDSKTNPSTLEETQSVIRKYTERQGGPEALAEKMRLISEEEAALRYIREEGVRLGRGENFGDRALNFLSDGQFPIRDIDERFGTMAEPVHRELNSRLNRMSFARGEFRKELGEMFRANKSVDRDLTSPKGRVYAALNSGDTAGLTPAELKAFQSFRKYFDDGLEYVNRLVKDRDSDVTPLSIPATQNYVPHMLLNNRDLQQELTKRVDAALAQASTRMGRKITDMAEIPKPIYRELLQGSGPLAEIAQAVELISGQAPIRNNSADLSAKYKDLFKSREGRANLETLAKSAIERTGEVPEWMREHNLYKLADRWAGNTLRHLYIRQPIDKLSSIVRQVKRAGGELEAGYLERLLQDLQGVRKGTAAEFTLNAADKYYDKLDLVAKQNPSMRGAVAAAKAIPEILGDLNKQIYPNLLGLSPRAILMNSTQLLAKTAPELGGSYGYTALARGALNSFLNFPDQVAKMEAWGLAPDAFHSKYRQAVADGIRRSSLYSIPQEALNKMSEVAMYLYTKLDTINRAVTLSTAETMASDLARGSKQALSSLNKFPGSVRKQVSRAGSEQEVARILASHLNASTQYNYNRASMSEWGRTMGPLFSTFSKWPTATVGEAISELRSKGALGGAIRNAEKFVVPLLLFQLFDKVVLGEGGDEDISARKQKLFGKYGLSQSAPIGSAAAILKGDFFTPPAVDAVIKGLLIPAMNNEPDKVVRGLDAAVQNFAPGAGMARFVTDDLVTLITGERPEGTTFTERTAAGAKRMGK